MYNSTHNFDNLDEVDQFLGNHQLPRITQDEINNLNSLQNIKESKFVVKISRSRWFHWWILPNMYRRNNTNSAESLPESRSGENMSKFILQGQHYSDAKTR